MEQNITIVIEEIEPIEEEPIIFTRYLYLKEDAEYSLYESCTDKKEEESFFWAYELYYSGFPEDVFSILLQIIEESIYFDKRTEKFIDKKIEEWRNDHSKHEIVATIIYNIILYKKKQVLENISKKRLFVIMQHSKIEMFKTIEPEKINGYKARKIIPQVCKYSAIKTADHPETIRQKWYYHWLYYASFSPIWSKRIEEFGGKRTEKKIVFHNDDKEEDFYELYGYEPDEQKREIQEKMIRL